VPEPQDPRRPPPGTNAARWDDSYRTVKPAWDIDRPQPAFVRLADAGEFTSPVLDCGCGTGEQALMLATRGLEVTGVDFAPAAIQSARRKARERGLSVDFDVADALHLPAFLSRQFASVVDSGVFHVFDDQDRSRYVASLAGVVPRGGMLHLLCFSELTPGDLGPRRVTQDEIRAAFADGWLVERIEAERFDVRDGFFAATPQAWLARIVRADDRATDEFAP
jgi:cyclopropane fatty-acyl-phospholipid synthase-like methyltransferase